MSFEELSMNLCPVINEANLCNLLSALNKA